MKSASRFAMLSLLVGVACADGSASEGIARVDAGAPSLPRDSGVGDAPAPVSDASAPVPFQEWRQREPIYELYVRHFSKAGNFKGVEAKLPELKALGVGIIWLLPVHEIGSISPANGGQGIDAPHGNPYAVKSYERLNPEYGEDGTSAGAEADLKSLVTRVHALGMHVILDWVPNHTAWDNPLITTHPEWYARQNGVIKPVSEFPWIAQLDWSNPALRTYMADAMESFTRKFDLDGFRVDYAHSMPLSFFSDLRSRLERVKPVLLLAEAGDVAFHPTFDMTYDWNVYPLLRDVAWGTKPVTAIDDALLHTQLIPYASMPDALVMRMTYNHDDNGKFTLGDAYRGGIKTFAVLAATLPGKPLVFDGQEVGMNVFDGTTVRPSINLGHDPKVKIDWADPEGYRPFYTKLLQLYRASSALHHPGMADFRKIDTVPAAPIYSFVRRDGASSVLVVLNLSPTRFDAAAFVPKPDAGPIEGDYVELFTNAPMTVDGGTRMMLEPWAYRVYVRGPLRAD